MSALEERKRRIAQLVEWMRLFLKKDFDSRFADFHSGSPYMVFEEDGKRIMYPSLYYNMMLRLSVEEARKRWMVSEGTGRDYAKMAISTLEGEIARKANALQSRWKT